MRVVRPTGELLADTYWGLRSNNHSDMLSLLVTNSVTGAASLFPRELLDDALPFPPAQFAHFHDHWIALCALATGDIRYVDRPLYDYVQHGGAVVGHARANRMPGLRERIPSLWRDPRERVRVWRMHYFGDVCRLIQFATMLELRCGARMSAPKRRVLERFARGDSSVVPLARLGARGARELLGRRRETLGGEWMLMHAFAWRHLLDATVRDEPRGRLRLDAVPPPMPDPNPGVRAGEEPGLRALREKIAPLRLAVSEDAPRRVNLLIPTIDLRHFFGGYIAKFALAKRLAGRGLRVRVVTVDPTGPLGPSWRRQVEAHAGLGGVFDAVEVAFGRESDALEVSPADAFVATTWWTAHVANAALESVEADRFLYLIQEYEPFTFPMGSLEALARASYRLPARRAVLDRAAARLLPPPRHRRARRRRVGRVPQRDHGGAAADRGGAGRAQHAPAAVLRPAGAACRAQHVRARRAGARPRGRARRVRRLDAARDRHGRGRAAARPRRRVARAAAALGAGRLRGAAARARRRAGADVHAAPQPRADRDGVGRDADGDEQLREQDGGRDGGDLAELRRRRARDRRDRRRACAHASGGRGRLRAPCERRARRLEPRLGRLARRRADGARRRVALP